MLGNSVEMLELSLRYEDKRVFDGLSVALAHGENLLISGSNGSGKTSLLRILAGELSPSGGQFKVDQTMYMPVSPVNPGFRRVSEYLRLTSGAITHSLAFTENVAARLSHKSMKAMSSGEFKAAALARVLSIKRHVYLLDEPTTTLDRSVVQEFILALKELNSRGHSIVVATNNPDDFKELNYVEINLETQ